MKTLSTILLLTAMLGFGCASSTPPVAHSTNDAVKASEIRSGSWQKLGERTVNHRVERDEIRVGARDGAFRRIKLVVKRRAVNFRAVKVHYANGSIQDIDLRRSIPAGGETRAIDLNGRDRIIEKVVFYYDTKRQTGRRAVVQLFGIR